MNSLIYYSPIGPLELVEENGALISVSFREDICSASDTGSVKQNTVLISVSEWLDCYFKDKIQNSMNFRIQLGGTEFEKEVWSIVSRIPFGATVSYGEIASEIAKKRGIEKMSAQAVGQAIGKNPIPIIIPCHRVIGKSGSLIGYSGGIEKKIALLSLEGSFGRISKYVAFT